MLFFRWLSTVWPTRLSGALHGWGQPVVVSRYGTQWFTNIHRWIDRRHCMFTVHSLSSFISRAWCNIAGCDSRMAGCAQEAGLITCDLRHYVPVLLSSLYCVIYLFHHNIKQPSYIKIQNASSRIITGSIAQSANLPVFSLLRGQFWGFSPHRGDTLHRWGWNLAWRRGPWRRGPKVPSSMPNFTPIGATTRV